MSIIKETAGDITLYTIVNKQGAKVTLSTLGAGIVSVVVPDRNGEMADVALGYANPADYLADGPCAGKTPGRYANRIGRGHLEIGGKHYQLAINNGPNSLHGGPTGFQNRIWNAATEGDDTVVFTYHSADAEENYPGNFDAKVTYRWDDDNGLSILLEAVTDAPTVVNLTNHAYFNLAGHNSGSVLGHLLQMNCSKWLPTDESLCPTGEIAPVEGTPLDFRAVKPIGCDMLKADGSVSDFPAMQYGKGYDNCFVVDDYQPGVIAEVATLTDPASGRMLQVFTDQPGAQVYAGCWLSGCPAGKDGAVYRDYDGVAIECQGFPDAPNKPNFPSQLLLPGEIYCRNIIYRFATIH